MKRDFIRRALTRRRAMTEVPPSERLVLAVYVTIVAIAGLTALEIVYIIVFKTWNQEIFAAITVLIGTVIGTLLGVKM